MKPVSSIFLRLNETGFIRRREAKLIGDSSTLAQWGAGLEPLRSRWREPSTFR
jgi:hypothetical protein